MQWTPFLFLRISCDSIEYFTLNWPRWYLIVSSYFYSRKMHQYTGFFHGGSRWKIRNVALPCGHRLRKIFQSIVISDDFCNPQLVQKRFVADSFSTSLVKNVFRTPRPHSDLPFLIISFFVIFSAFFLPRGFADAVLGTAYLLFLLFLLLLLLENFFEFHEKSGHSLHC